MRLNKIKNLFVVLTLGLSTHSCLDLEPQEQLAETNYWNTPDDYMLFANQFYGWTRHFSGAMEYKSTKPVHSDYTSDLFTNKDERNLFSNGMLYSLRMLTIPAITRTSAVRICY